MTHNTDKTFLGYDARQIANWFVEKAVANNHTLLLSSMIKLIYITHGWHLSIYEKPLYWNETVVWSRGPVVPDVYRAFKKQGVNVKNPVDIEAESFSQETKDLLEKVYDTYGDYESEYLSEITHVKDSPWDLAKKIGGLYARIPNGSIKQHYDLMRVETENKKMKSARGQEQHA